ncbi:MAG TPA: recombinase family protein [Nitrospira sp.]|nr:recombinase family protein [Nitrospira sp.]HNC84762.1 recombinase family protein [Nitrospira sp.]
MTAVIRKMRCAIYTRKSTEEGLDMDYNSLDAQRDACHAFIASQKSEGWVALRDAYEDGGFSGGTLNRPGVQRLLEDVQEGLIDVIVVYKIDRLSRSLADFSKLVELFDEHKVTFVSVTQSFNTTTSMGRLTLNILLSFAQFERELGGERVRDKIAASRAKGIWMGGMPPLGYDVVERKLVPNPVEAKLVSHIFERFVALGSMTVLANELRAEGVTTKSWTTIKEKHRAGKLIDKGYLYKLFKNPVVIGIAAYKGKHFPGEHQPILDKELWDQVQEMLGRTDRDKRARVNRPSRAPALLKGLIFANDGWAMTPGATMKGGKRYRYYINTASMKIGKDACEVTRVPAGDIDAKVVEQIRKILQSPEVIAQAVREVQKIAPGTDEQLTIQTLQSIESVWDELFPTEQSRITHLLIDRITISPTGIKIDMKTEGMRDLVESVLAVPTLKKAA